MSSDTFNHDTEKKILQQTGILLFAWNILSDDIMLTDTTETLFPYHGIFDFKTSKEFYRQIHSTDRKKLRQFWESTYKKSNKNWKYNDVDVRFLTADGEALWLRISLLNASNPKDNVIYGSLQNITKDKRELLKTAHTAYTDDMTGLLNRSRMKQKIALAIGASQEYNISSIFLTISIDNLASINNMFGHHIADDIIQAVGRHLSLTKRKSDLIARLSSGKFGILLTDVKAEDMQGIGQRFLAAIRETDFLTRSGSICITASGGGCFIPKDANIVDHVFSLADECLSMAKRYGRNCFIPYTLEPTKAEERSENIILSGKIVQAIRENRIIPAYQPVVNQRNPEKSFFEMLARIKNPDGTFIPAYKFIPIAENTGFIRMIDMQILKSALNTLHDNEDISVSINLSGHTLSNPSIADDIFAQCKNFMHVSDRLIIELTETVALQDVYGLPELITGLHEMGFRVALDDFGAGYNSFSNLQNYSFDIVKIDGSYIRGIHDNKRNQIFVEALASMSEQLGLEIVAEMVSGEGEVEILKNYPIDYYQGYLFGKPETDLSIAISDMNKAKSVIIEANIKKKSA